MLAAKSNTLAGETDEGGLLESESEYSVEKLISEINAMVRLLDTFPLQSPN